MAFGRPLRFVMTMSPPPPPPPPPSPPVVSMMMVWPLSFLPCATDTIAAAHNNTAHILAIATNWHGHELGTNWLKFKDRGALLWRRRCHHVPCHQSHANGAAAIDGR